MPGEYKRFLCIGLDDSTVNDVFPSLKGVVEKYDLGVEALDIHVRTRTGAHLFTLEYMTLQRFEKMKNTLVFTKKNIWDGVLVWMTPDMREFADSVKQIFEWHQLYHGDYPLMMVWYENDLEAFGIDFPSQGLVSVFGPVKGLGNFFLIIMPPEAKPDDLWYRIAELSTDMPMIVKGAHVEKREMSFTRRIFVRAQGLLASVYMPKFVSKRLPPLPPHPITVEKIIERIKEPKKKKKNVNSKQKQLIKYPQLRKPVVSKRRPRIPKKERIENFNIIADLFSSLGRTVYQAQYVKQKFINDLEKKEIPFEIRGNYVFVKIPFEEWAINMVTGEGYLASNVRKRIWRLPWQIRKNFKATQSDNEKLPFDELPSRSQVWKSITPIRLDFIAYNCIPYWRKIVQTVKKGLSIIKESRIIVNPEITDFEELVGIKDQECYAKFPEMKFFVKMYYSEIINDAAKGELESSIHAKVWEHVAKDYVNMILNEFNLKHSFKGRRVIIKGKYHEYEIDVISGSAYIKGAKEPLCIVPHSSMDRQAILKDPLIEKLTGLPVLILTDKPAMVLPTIFTLINDDEITDQVLLSQIIW